MLQGLIEVSDRIVIYHIPGRLLLVSYLDIQARNLLHCWHNSDDVCV